MSKNNSSAHASHFLEHFDIHCMTTTLIFMEDVNIQQWISFLFEPG